MFNCPICSFCFASLLVCTKLDSAWHSCEADLVTYCFNLNWMNWSETSSSADVIGIHAPYSSSSWIQHSGGLYFFCSSSYRQIELTEPSLTQSNAVAFFIKSIKHLAAAVEAVSAISCSLELIFVVCAPDPQLSSRLSARWIIVIITTMPNIDSLPPNAHLLDYISNTGPLTRQHVVSVNTDVWCQTGLRFCPSNQRTGLLPFILMLSEFHFWKNTFAVGCQSELLAT